MKNPERTEPLVYRTWTEHEPNFFLKYSEPEQNRTLMKEPKHQPPTQNFVILAHLYAQ